MPERQGYWAPIQNLWFCKWVMFLLRARRVTRFSGTCSKSLILVTGEVLIPLPSGKRYSQSVSFSSLEEFKDSQNPLAEGVYARILLFMAVFGHLWLRLLRDIAQIKIVTRIEMSKKFERHFKILFKIVLLYCLAIKNARVCSGNPQRKSYFDYDRT